MFLGLGATAYTASMFHVITHAFFKALLFLGAGSVIHAMSDEQDIRNMGGIWRKIPVTYVVFPDEGHGFARPVNAIAFNAVAENFLAKCLGGRAEPIGTALQGSTAQVKAGAGNVEGLGTTAGN